MVPYKYIYMYVHRLWRYNTVLIFLVYIYQSTNLCSSKGGFETKQEEEIFLLLFLLFVCLLAVRVLRIPITKL